MRSETSSYQHGSPRFCKRAVSSHFLLTPGRAGGAAAGSPLGPGRSVISPFISFISLSAFTAFRPAGREFRVSPSQAPVARLRLRGRQGDPGGRASCLAPRGAVATADPALRGRGTPAAAPRGGHHGSHAQVAEEEAEVAGPRPGNAAARGHLLPPCSRTRSELTAGAAPSARLKSLSDPPTPKLLSPEGKVHDDFSLIRELKSCPTTAYGTHSPAWRRTV